MAINSNDEFFGSAVAMSATGTVLAVASRHNGIGKVSVFGIACCPYLWSPLGDGLLGDTSNDQFGASLALSANGTVLAVGAPKAGNAGAVRVFRYDSKYNLWRLVQTVVGETAGDAFGSAVALSADGIVLAVGAPENDDKARIAGSVRVFRYGTFTHQFSPVYAWLGGGIDGQAARDRFGSSVALSENGFIVAAGAQRNDDNGVDAGSVRVFEHDWWTNRWILRGQATVGESAGDWFGRAVSLSADGTVLAATSRRNSANGRNAGVVRALRFDSETNTWVSMGQSILGTTADEHFGASVDLSADGTILACGAAHYHGPAGKHSGQVRLFAYDSVADQWDQLGESLDGDKNGDLFGSAVALSADGNRVAVGGPRHDGENGLTNAGHVRVYFSLPGLD